MFFTNRLIYIIMKAPRIVPALFIAMSEAALAFHAQAASSFDRQMDMSGITGQTNERLLRPCARLS
jgi:hypothetical protein